MQAAYRDMMLFRVSNAKKQQLAQSQGIFEQGRKTGKLLAWLAKEQQPISSIARIRDADGTLVVDPLAINARFTCYYADLYSSKVDYSEEELGSFLDQITFPTLSAMARDSLDGFITVEKVQQALGDLQAGKTPGTDGLPPEFYKQYGEHMTPKLHEVIVKTLKDGELPASMSEAVIVVIPKPGKDPELCTSYRPISLLNADSKILTKVLARRLNEVILTLVHEDHSGFYAL